VRRWLDGILVLLALGAAVLAQASYAPASRTETDQLPVFESADLVPAWRSAAELRKVPGRFPEFALQDQAGAALTRADLDGRIVVANFFFASCGTLCPRLRSAMARVREAHAGDDVLLLSHSVTPEADTVPMLAAYARANGIDGRQWRLVTGARETVRAVMHQGYLVPVPASAPVDGIVHTELFVLLDGRQRVRGIYNGTLAIDIDHLIEDIRTLRGA
jgi:protein SCO1/2